MNKRRRYKAKRVRRARRLAQQWWTRPRSIREVYERVTAAGYARD